MRKQWWSESLGRIELEIPVEAIAACSHQGQCDKDVEYWTPKIDWSHVTRKAMEQSLNEYGAWDDLQTTDIETLKQRLTWLACCDLNEENYEKASV
jgi:hypothetical protein